MQWTPDAIVEVFRKYPAPYQRDAVDACLALRESMTDRLLAEFEAWLAHPDPAADCHGMFPFYAMTILSHWRVHRAHALIVQMLSRPGTAIADLLDEHLTDDIPRMLIWTSHGDLSAVESLLANENLDPWVRWAAITALQIGIRCGHATLDFVRDLLAAQLSVLEERASQHERTLSKKELESREIFVSALVSTLADLHPGRHEHLVREAFSMNLVDLSMLSWEDVQRDMALTEKERSSLLESRVNMEPLDSVHDEMEWWACFPQEAQPLPSDAYGEWNFGGVFPYSSGLSMPAATGKKKIGRNDPCPCGSGKKYKKCCL